MHCYCINYHSSFWVKVVLCLTMFVIELSHSVQFAPFQMCSFLCLRSFICRPNISATDRVTKKCCVNKMFFRKQLLVQWRCSLVFCVLEGVHHYGCSSLNPQHFYLCEQDLPQLVIMIKLTNKLFKTYNSKDQLAKLGCGQTGKQTNKRSLFLATNIT